MPSTLAQKLKVKENYTLLTLHAPTDFYQKLNAPANVTVTEKSKDFHQVHWFVLNRAQMEKEVAKVIKLLKPGVTCWIYYPKGTSKMQTDLTRDKGWDELLKHKELTWVNLISFDDTWSTFGMRLKNESDEKKQAKPKQREIFQWVNPTTKEVKLPDDLLAAFKNNMKALQFFETISFTNKKEYVEWIITAKKRETRAERITATIERLGKQWKNPRNI